MGTATYHLSVLPNEVRAWLSPQPGGRFLDATLGGGGHAADLLAAIGPTGHLYGIDQDPAALEEAGKRLTTIGSNVTLRQGNFETVLADWDLPPLDGILMDLGVSSHQLDTAERGFSFMREGPLDMRMDSTAPVSAATLLATASEAELADWIFRYGEERHARAIARAIVRAREAHPLETTSDLVELVSRIVPRSKDGINPATRTFQALRIAVNDELGVLERALPTAVARLKVGGRLAVISFHSLEDRLVKQFMRSGERGCVCPPRIPQCVCGRTPTLEVLTPKPVVAGADELRANPRSRSAKLRVARKIA